MRVDEINSYSKILGSKELIDWVFATSDNGVQSIKTLVEVKFELNTGYKNKLKTYVFMKKLFNQGNTTNNSKWGYETISRKVPRFIVVMSSMRKSDYNIIDLFTAWEVSVFGVFWKNSEYEHFLRSDYV